MAHGAGDIVEDSLVMVEEFALVEESMPVAEPTLVVVVLACGRYTL